MVENEDPGIEEKGGSEEKTPAVSEKEKENAEEITSERAAQAALII